MNSNRFAEKAQEALQEAQPLEDVELNITIAFLDTLQATDLSPLDAVYLGNPICRELKENLLENLGQLHQAIDWVHRQGKRVYLTTYIGPTPRDFAHIDQLFRLAWERQVDAVEIFDMGVLRRLHCAYPAMPIHVGALANVYTQLGAQKLATMGVRRMAPNCELSLDEIDAIFAGTGVEVELTIHGKFIIAAGASCTLQQAYDLEQGGCRELCLQDHRLRWYEYDVRQVGKAILSGKDLAMLVHLRRLLAQGYRCFRIEGLYEGPDYVSAIAGVYRRHLQQVAGGAEPVVSHSDRQVISRHSAHLCNGFYFARSGQDYIETEDNGGGAFPW